MIEFTEYCDGAYSPGERYDFGQEMERLYVNRKVAFYVIKNAPLPEAQPIAAGAFIDAREDKAVKSEDRRVKRKG